MCDYCELIFTAKEKLEIHVARAHVEELQAVDQVAIDNYDQLKL